jgi:hypothetical protein
MCRIELQSTEWDKQNDIEQNDIEQNDIKQNDNEQNDIEQNDIEQNDIEQNDIEQNDIEQNDNEQNEIEQNDIEENDIEQNDIQQNNIEQNDIEQNHHSDSCRVVISDRNTFIMKATDEAFDQIRFHEGPQNLHVPMNIQPSWIKPIWGVFLKKKNSLFWRIGFEL